MHRLIITLLVGLVLPGLVFGQAEVSSEVDRATITIGDRITYTIHIKYDKDLEVRTPGLGANLGQFEIQDFTIGDEIEENSRISQTFTYLISTYDTGEWEIPPTAIAFADSSGQVNILKTQPIKITVESILDPNAPPEIKDVKPPILLPKSYKWLYILGGIILFLALLSAFLIYWRRKRAKGLGLFEAVVPQIPPYELAMQRLKILDYSKLYDALSIKIYYSDLSYTLRAYFEGQFGFDALEMTTYEISQVCHEYQLSDENIARITEVLALCDLVKFSKFIPENRFHEYCWKEVYNIVEDTKPEEEVREEEVPENKTGEQEEEVEAVAAEEYEDETP